MSEHLEKFIAAHEQLKKFGAEIIAAAMRLNDLDKRGVEEKLKSMDPKDDRYLFERLQHINEGKERGLKVFIELYQQALDSLLRGDSEKIVDIYKIAVSCLQFYYQGHKPAISDKEKTEHNAEMVMQSTFGSGVFNNEQIDKLENILESFNLLPEKIKAESLEIKTKYQEWWKSIETEARTTETEDVLQELLKSEGVEGDVEKNNKKGKD